MKKNVKLTVLIVVALAVIIIAIAIYMNYNKTNKSNVTSSVITETISDNDENVPDEAIISDVHSQIKVYTIMFSKVHATNKGYKLDDDFSINANVTVEDDMSLKLTINNNAQAFSEKLLYDDDTNTNAKSFRFDFYRIGDYIAFKSHDYSSDRDKHFYLFDKEGNLHKDLYELDINSPGMVIKDIKFEGHSIIIEGTRLDKGPTIVYSNDEGNMPKDTAIEATYTYNMTDGNIDFNNPEIIVTKTYQDFLNSLK